MRFAAAIVLVAACGSKHTPVQHRVEMHGMQFVPAKLVIDAGDTVVWTNNDVLPHTVTDLGIFDSQALAPKIEWGWTFMQRGEWPYTCSFHPTMKGVIEVR